MEKYLYYKRGDEWVRVKADAYSLEYQNDPTTFNGGQCVVEYRVLFTVDQLNSTGGYVNTLVDRSIGQFVKGPIYEVKISNDKKRVISIGPNGTSASFSSVNSTYTFSNLRNIKVSRRDGLPDSCGNSPGQGAGTCSTIFKLNGSTVLTLGTCPEITNGRGCSDCCKELLPIARSITL